MAGIATFSEGDISLGVALILLGIPFAVWGKIISGNKAFKKWWKQVTDNNLEPAIANDLNVAISVYQKNPQNRTIKKIESLNASYAEYIRQNVANK